MSARSDDTMFAALYGELVPHRWRNAHVAASDAYSLFVARSSAMGWLASVAPAGGFWGMNDAGSVVEPGDGHRRQPAPLAWFQVSSASPLAHPSPVQPFLACVADVLARIGTAETRVVQLLLPGRTGPPPGGPPHPDALAALLQDAGWFADTEPGGRTRVRVTVDSGQAPGIPAAAPDMVRWIRRLRQDVFQDATVSTVDAGGDDVLSRPAVGDHLWQGPSRHRVTLVGTLPEWSLDAVGWLAALLVEAAGACGAASPLLITAAPVPPGTAPTGAS